VSGGGGEVDYCNSQAKVGFIAMEETGLDPNFRGNWLAAKAAGRVASNVPPQHVLGALEH